MSAEPAVRVVRLGPMDHGLARQTFLLLATIFDEHREPLSEPYVTELLGHDRLLAYAAVTGARPVGGLVAHVLPGTARERAEVFLYDIAVDAAHRGEGVGRSLVQALRADAARHGARTIFVAADDADTGALDFYHSLGAHGSPVTVFELDVDPVAGPDHDGRGASGRMAT